MNLSEIQAYLVKYYQAAKLVLLTGFSAIARAALTENHSLTEAAKRSPKGVVCLLSGLRFHGLTRENPAEVWIAIPRGAPPPKSGTPAPLVAQATSTGNKQLA